MKKCVEYGDINSWQVYLIGAKRESVKFEKSVRSYRQTLKSRYDTRESRKLNKIHSIYTGDKHRDIFSYCSMTKLNKFSII